MAKTYPETISAVESPRSVRLVILGQLYSMKNSKIPRRNAPGMLKHPKAQRFERDFLLQVRPEHRKELGSRSRPLQATVHIFYPSLRQDLDAELVFDLLQKAHVVRNDRYIRQKYLIADVDSKNPRVEIEIMELPTATAIVWPTSGNRS